ncbi:hypothetical protein OUZ56_024086 [Daphnia magna]|uniref:HAT C-terminal dimerisation domain-containing protein n=1 Tax=Daphnia magna TaxID=35525 RepID=A0ABR0B048_9CRUS|nr:hypothetical protein OUZ56_024086 [Daphnia magna]
MKKRASTEISEADHLLNTCLDSLDDLNYFPTIKQILIEFNSALPSYAACERLYSTVGLIGDTGQILNIFSVQNMKVKRKFWSILSSRNDPVQPGKCDCPS